MPAPPKNGNPSAVVFYPGGWVADGAGGRLAALGEIDTVAIVSTEAGPGMAEIHHREPVVLERADWPLWLGEAGHGAAVLMTASAAGVMSPPFRVGVAVNSNRATGAQLIQPLVT